MKTNKCLAFLMAFALAAIPAAALADDLYHDDGTFEAFAPLSLTAVPAVQFDAPGTGVYALDNVSFYLEALDPGTYPVAVQIWDDALAVVETIPWDVAFTVNAVYTLDLTSAKLPFTGSVRIGISLRDDGVVPLPAVPMNLSVDTTTPAGFSFMYDSVATPPTWTPDTASNYGIRASVHLVPALTCRGFLPPLGHTVTMKKGGRTLPLKAFLFDSAGAPVTQGLLAALPAVQLLYASEAGAEPIDVTSAVAPAGRSNRGLAFRSTSEGMLIYNLKTKKNFPPGTYTVLMGSGEGTGYVVEPTCTGTFVIEVPKTKKSHPPKGSKN